MNALGARPTRIRGSGRGQSLLELAATLPLMMMLIMGVIDFGWVLYAHVQVAAASYEGARAGAVFKGNWEKDAVTVNDPAREDAVRNAILGGSNTALGVLDTADADNFDVDRDVQISYRPSAPINNVRQGQEMIVRVTYHQPVWFPVLPGISGGRFDVSTTTKVRIQN